jgi:hypothetical protein
MIELVLNVACRVPLPHDRVAIAVEATTCPFYIMTSRVARLLRMNVMKQSHTPDQAKEAKPTCLGGHPSSPIPSPVGPTEAMNARIVREILVSILDSSRTPKLRRARFGVCNGYLVGLPGFEPRTSCTPIVISDCPYVLAASSDCSISSVFGCHRCPSVRVLEPPRRSGSDVRGGFLLTADLLQHAKHVPVLPRFCDFSIRDPDD